MANSPPLYVATRKGLFTFTRDGSRWAVSRSAFVGDTLSMVLPDTRDGSLYAALHHGHFGCKLHRSADGGVTWQECAVPVYPPPPEGEPQVDAFGRQMPHKLDKIWSLEAGGPDEPGLLWCGTLPGGLFRSADRGSSWEMVRPLWDEPKRKEWFGGGADWPGIHSVCVDPRDSRHVLVGVSCGGVWRTRDGGGSWVCCADGMRANYMPPDRQFEPYTQDPHRVVACPADFDRLWAQHHNGIFRSTDGSMSWQEIKDVAPSTFGFAVAVHPRDGDTAWFVPGVSDERRIPPEGRVIVTRTRDGGKSFEVLRHGLPQEHAYDLTYRHCLDIDATGNVLAFGSTTGSLWVTEDGGESWQHAAAHLPPVYCVRFAK